MSRTYYCSPVGSSLILAISFCGVLTGQGLSLRDAIRRALLRNPSLIAAQARVDEALGNRVQAGLRPNPRLVLQTEDIRFWQGHPRSFGNTTEDYGYLGQVIETGGKRERRVDTASAAADVTVADQERIRRATAFNVANAYWSAAAAFRIRDLFKETLHTYEDDVVYIRNRVEAGVMAESDLMRTELERDRIREQVLTAARDADQACVDLFRAMGEVANTDITLSDTIETVAPAPLIEPQSVEQSRPEFRAARATIREAEANLRLQKANARPDPEAFFGYKRDVGLDTLYGALQIDLPVRNRNQGNIEAAQARLRAAQAEMRLLDISIRDDLAAATKAYLDERELLTTFPATRSRAEEFARVTRAAYREGAIDLLRLLDAERSRIDVDVQYIRALAQAQQAALNLRLAGSAEVIDGWQP